MRHKKAPKRVPLPDPKFGRTDVAKFINYIMRRGKKTVAQQVVYDALEHISNEIKSDALEVFDEAMKNIMPSVEVKSKRVGGANYQVPINVRPERRLVLGSRWLIDAARAKKGKPMALRLAEELMLAAKGEGSAVKKRADVQRMAEANRAFAHFAR